MGSKGISTGFSAFVEKAAEVAMITIVMTASGYGMVMLADIPKFVGV